MKHIALLSCLALSFALTPASAEQIKSNVKAETVSKSRQTPYDLYLTPKDAYAALTKNPDIVLIDVRDPIEISFVGHPKGMDANIPLMTVSHKFNSKSGSYSMIQNKTFTADVAAMMKRLGYTKSDTIFVSCRSGARSAVAARLLHKAGYKNVWNLTEGFEGSIDGKTGARSKNGWRNAGLPWSYKIPASAAWVTTAN